jgi:hypothetical protein
MTVSHLCPRQRHNRRRNQKNIGIMAVYLMVDMMDWMAWGIITFCAVMLGLALVLAVTARR